MRDQFIKTLSSAVETDPNIILITGDLGFGVLDDFKEQFPNNFINAGVAEQNMTGIAAGMALEGKIVFTYSIANFPTLRCLEQIRNDVCYHNLNVNIVSIGGGFSYGPLGVSHHATEDLAIMRSLPDITVISPSGLWETIEATKALIENPGAGFLRLDKSYGVDNLKSGGNEKFQIGKSRVVNDGDDCTIFVTGGILEEAQLAAERLKGINIATRIISMHTIKPLDKNAVIDAYNSTKIIVTLEEHTIYGGLGSAIAEVLVDNQLTGKKVLRIGLEEGFSSIVGSQKYLRKCYNMDSNSIFNRVSKLFFY
jgi:transketolase